MKKGFYIFIVTIIALSSCKDNDVNLFDKSADERVAEAIASLKADLTAPANGWRVKYTPVDTLGSYYVLMKFNDNNQLYIESDLPYDDGKYFRDTITYRIDNSLGLELILENYSMFSFLFEANDAQFMAEFEFIYINKTPDNALVFKSKTDPSDPTILVFEEADENDTSLPGPDLASNLYTLRRDLGFFASSQKITFQNKDLVLYTQIDDFGRTIDISSASKKTNIGSTASFEYTSPYVIKGDSIVFDIPFQKSMLGYNISIKAIKLNNISDASINTCTDPVATHILDGVTSANDIIALESSYVNITGLQFFKESDFYYMPLVYIIKDSTSASDMITADIQGALEFDMIYDVVNDDYRIGFYLQNTDGNYTFAYREFIPTLIGNNVQFNLEPDLHFSGPAPDADPDAINAYLNALTEANYLYALKITDGEYEFTNPCTGWTFIALDAN